MEIKTLQMITESIIKQIKPEITDNQFISESWLDDKVDDVRAALVPALYNGHDMFLDWHQKIDLQSTTELSVVIDGYTYNYKKALSVIQLPGTLMQGMGWNNVLHFGSHGLECPKMQRVTIAEFQEYEFHRFGNNIACYVVVGDRILMKNTGLQKYFTGSFCFAKPSCVPSFDRTTSIYPLPVVHHHKLEIILFQHLAPKMTLPSDIISNSIDDTKIGNMQQAIRESQKEGVQ